MNLLEKIATELLKGKITNEQARELVKGVKFPKGKSNISVERDNLFLWGDNGNLLSTINYSLVEGPEGHYLFIQNVLSQVKGKGYFSRLFSELESIAERNNVNYMCLRVDARNKEAIDIYFNKGFEIVSSHEELGMLDMRKDL